MPPIKLAAYGLNVFLGAGAGLAGAAADAGFSSLVIAAAFAGSASAIVFNAANLTEKPVETLYIRVLKAFCFFLIGAGYGLFMGGSIAGMVPGLERIGATYLGGLLGYAMVAILLSRRMRESLAELIFAALRVIATARGKGGSDDPQ